LLILLVVKVLNFSKGFPYFVDNVFFGFEAIVFIGVDIILDFFAKILLLFEYRVRNEELLF